MFQDSVQKRNWMKRGTLSFILILLVAFLLATKFIAVYYQNPYEICKNYEKTCPGRGWFLGFPFEQRIFLGDFFPPQDISLIDSAGNDQKSASGTSGWQIYRNDEFGFEVKYPREWEVLKNSGESTRYFSISLRDKKYDGLIEWPGISIDNLGFQDIEIRAWSVHPARIFSYETAKDSVDAIYFDFDGRRLYATCAFYFDPLVLQLCNQILATFRFLE